MESVNIRENYYPILKAVSYAQIASATKVFNSKTTEYYLWVELPVDHVRDFKVYEILDLGSDCCCKKELNHEFYHRESNKYLKLTFEVLDHSIGKHIYQLKLISPLDDVISLYISYIIQDDNPDKPYIYMDRTID